MGNERQLSSTFGVYIEMHFFDFSCFTDTTPSPSPFTHWEELKDLTASELAGKFY